MGDSVDVAALRAKVDWLIGELVEAETNPDYPATAKLADPEHMARVRAARQAILALRTCYDATSAERERLCAVARDGARAVIALENQLIAELVDHRVDHSPYVTG